MDLNLAGKVVLVSGGAKGIGEAVVLALATEGAIPVILGRKGADNQVVLNKMQELGVRGHAITAELTRPQECQRAVEEALQVCGRIDALVNNAGVNDNVSLASGNYEAFMASLHKNVVHYYLLAHYCLEQLKLHQGSIINIGSKVADTGQGGTSGYAASNGGRNALTREWAVELLPFGIRVNAVIVAECFTPLYEKWIDSQSNPKERLAQICARIPLGRRMTLPAEIADTVLFLLSDRSSHTTGQLLYVDGGYVHLDRAL
jgi:NAD(P)-dependent dehydrogenase (short-subunit alcohol dehydrogenase family)